MFVGLKKGSYITVLVIYSMIIITKQINDPLNNQIAQVTTLPYSLSVHKLVP